MMPSQLHSNNNRRKSTMVAMALLSSSARAFNAPSRRLVASKAIAVNRNPRCGSPSFSKSQLCMSTTADKATSSVSPVDSRYDLENKAQGIIGKYEPQLFEEKIYKWWEEAGCFQPDAKQTKEEAASNGREPYVLPMPPPNVTGRLHMGHAIFVGLQDVLARFHRMRGRPVLWLPGKWQPFHESFI